MAAHSQSQDLLGQVTLNDAPTKSKLFRFCEKKIDQWIQAHRSEGRVPAEFRVSFNEDDGEQVSCVTEILVDGSTWRGCDLASDVHEAFMHSLKRLQPH